MPALKCIFTVATAAALLSVLTGPVRAVERVALVIGNAAYEHTTPLRNPRNDATDVARALEGLGFEVIEGLDLDERAFESKLREFAQAARGAEVTLLFYAGHGLQVEGENYLVPTDAQLAEEVDLRFEAFELAVFLRQMRGGTNLVFLDACRDNPLAQSLARSMGPTRSTAIGRGLGRVEAASGTLIAYATQPGNVADDGEGRNSPFTGALLAHIATPGLSVNDLLTSVTDVVVTGTAGRQQPWTHSSLRKSFYFKPAPSEDVREAYAAAERVGTIAAFRTVVDAFPGSAHAEQARTQIARLEAGKAPTEVELLFWESVKDSRHLADIEAYLERYPGGAYEVLARNRLKRLEGASAQPGPSAPAVAAPAPLSVAAEREFWALVKESDVSSDIEAYLEQYPEGVYAPVARIRLIQLQRERPAPQVAASPTTVPASEDSPVVPAAPAAVLASAGPTPQEVESTLGLGRAQRRLVQRGLASLGYAPGPADGLFGAGTREAIRRYQGAKGFEATGYLRGEESGALVALGEESARAQAEARREAQRREAERRAEAAQREKKPGRRFRDCAECPELVVVRSGSFMMGSRSGEAGRFSDEGPVHRVTIAEPIAVGVYEVTLAEWEACRRGGGCSHNPGDIGWGRGTRPVMNVSWEDAQEYVRWLSRETGERYRLLNESEWEYVARAGTGTRYWWGDAVGRGRANCDGCRSRWDGKQTAPVGSFSANGFGLHDVHGNVWEWVEDCSHGNYTGAPSDGRAWTRGGNCSARVLRGGSWDSIPRIVRSATRISFTTGSRYDYVGFRVARTMD